MAEQETKTTPEAKAPEQPTAEVKVSEQLKVEALERKLKDLEPIVQDFNTKKAEKERETLKEALRLELEAEFKKKYKIEEQTEEAKVEAEGEPKKAEAEVETKVETKAQPKDVGLQKKPQLDEPKRVLTVDEIIAKRRGY